MHRDLLSCFRADFVLNCLRRIWWLGSLLLLVVPEALLQAQVDVPEGFSVERWFVPGLENIEAIRNPAYGAGVIGAYIDQDTLIVWRGSPTGIIEIMADSLVVPGMEVRDLRFDQIGVYDGQLLINLRRGLTEAAIWTVSPDGVVTARGAIGDNEDRISGPLETTAGVGGYLPGAYLYDTHLPDGQPLLHLDSSFVFHELTSHTLPSGRSDIDSRGMRMDPTGQYGGYLTLVDADSNDDYLSAIYQILPDLSWRTLLSPVNVTERFLLSLAFSSGGDFGNQLFATDSIANVVWEVSPNGDIEPFATGFAGVNRITVNDQGTEMWVSDRGIVFHIYADGSSIDGGVSPSETRLQLGVPTPNPFSVRTRIRFSAPGDRNARLAIYDVTGREVQVLSMGVTQGGHSICDWHGTSETGEDVPDGVYLVRLSNSERAKTEKVVLMR